MTSSGLSAQSWEGIRDRLRSTAAGMAVSAGVMKIAGKIAEAESPPAAAFADLSAGATSVMVQVTLIAADYADQQRQAAEAAEQAKAAEEKAQKEREADLARQQQKAAEAQRRNERTLGLDRERVHIDRNFLEHYRDEPTRDFRNTA